MGEEDKGRSLTASSQQPAASQPARNESQPSLYPSVTRRIEIV